MITLQEYKTLCKKYRIPKISLDFYTDNYFCVPSKEMDNLRYLEITLTEYGAFRPVTEDEKTRIRLLKPDKTYVFNDCQTLEDGKLLVQLTKNMLASHGKAMFDIALYNKDEQIYSTKLTHLNIAKKPYPDEAIESTDEFSALSNALAHVELVNKVAEKSAQEAKISKENAQASETNAKESENSAKQSQTSAENSEINASASAHRAYDSELAAAQRASDASNYAKQAQSYATGTGNARPNEAIDNSKFYYEQCKTISESFSGALRPMGTVTFANLPSLSDAVEGDMYNVSDEFITNENFKEGSSLVIPAGSNVYKTADSKWDVLAGSPVTGVKGDKESGYRRGNVNMTPVDIGALSDETRYAASDSVGGAATSAAKLTSNAGSETQPIYFSDGKPVDCRYTLGTSVPNNAVFTDTWRGIQNNLTSTSTTDSLSANQGRLLDEKKQDKSADLNNLLFHYNNTQYPVIDGSGVFGVGYEIHTSSVVPTITYDNNSKIPMVPNTGAYKIVRMEPTLVGTTWRLRVVFDVNGTVAEIYL